MDPVAAYDALAAAPIFIFMLLINYCPFTEVDAFPVTKPFGIVFVLVEPSVKSNVIDLWQ